eukprot:gnl/MRDRNA2_/MRDRNA2_18578_c0_seq1.p1 gnl/MRDRNA2_/MRDRNA2_18578_c0~~gnl/MRDRNA2_/MRDRNA2_18578_c0_seq1.p1  ORF type:complete len:603 (+),score=100.69 gnl/MRDRNA2_/MRDRNA2_18578_c0_seq1:186-1811(+)
MADSVSALHEGYPWIGNGQDRLERCCCIVFTVEYLLKIWACVESPRYRDFNHSYGRFKFASTWWMIFELLILTAFWIDLNIAANVARGFQAVQAIRSFRLFAVLRVEASRSSLWSFVLIFRRHSSELQSSAFLGMLMLIICSTMMYYIEGVAQPEKFSSIPATMWWGVATLTTVGYGDMVPITTLGKIVGLMTMLCGVGLFALPAGILGSAFIEVTQLKEKKKHKQEFMEVEGELYEVEDELHDIHAVVEEENRRIERIENSLETVVAEVREIATTQRAILAALGLNSVKSENSSNASPRSSNISPNGATVDITRRISKSGRRLTVPAPAKDKEKFASGDGDTEEGGKEKKAAGKTRKRMTIGSMPTAATSEGAGKGLNSPADSQDHSPKSGAFGNLLETDFDRAQEEQVENAEDGKNTNRQIASGGTKQKHEEQSENAEGQKNPLRCRSLSGSNGVNSGNSNGEEAHKNLYVNTNGPVTGAPGNDFKPDTKKIPKRRISNPEHDHESLDSQSPANWYSSKRVQSSTPKRASMQNLAPDLA